jgi:hypothetical protein
MIDEDFERARRQARLLPTWWLRRRAKRITRRTCSTIPTRAQQAKLNAILTTIMARSS